MSGGASLDNKQRIKDAIDIVDLAGSYLSLRRAGRGFVALCPWHDDTRPSLQVNPERQSFKCWVCDIGGDIFSFVMKMEGVGFREALAMLADRAGISLEPPGRDAAGGATDDKRVLYQAVAWAGGRYHDCLLNDPLARAARAYLADRGITPQSIRTFQLGFAPDDWQWIQRQAAGGSFSSAMLERVGLISKRQRGTGYYDRFRGRLLFPIFDAQGRGVGLGGRILPQLAGENLAKYVNSPETPLFAKSKLLYGINVARDAIRKSRVALVTEGYTDCIMAHQAGFENAVAVLGTALGADHVKLLGQLADRVRVVLVLDGDEAGRRRAKEVLELFVAANVDLRVLTLPEGDDPADYLARHGPAAFEALISSASDALEHAFVTATAGIDLQADVQASTHALEELAATIARAPRLRADMLVEDRLREERFVQRLAGAFRVPEPHVRSLITKLRRKSAARGAPRHDAATASVREPIDPLERELLEILIQSPEMVGQVAGAIQPAQFVSGLCGGVFSQCLELSGAGTVPTLERLLLENDDPVVKNLLVELDHRGREKGPAGLNDRLSDVLRGFESRQWNQRMRDRTAELKQRRLAEEDELAALLELERHERARQEQLELRARQGTSELTDG